MGMCMETFFRLPEEKRTRFLDAAWEEFTRVSFSDASTNQIVRQAGVPRGSFYQYFRDKEDLFHYLMTQARDHFVELYASVLKRCGGDFFAAQLMCFDGTVEHGVEDALFQRWVRVLQLNPGLHMQMVQEDQPGFQMLARVCREMNLTGFADEKTAQGAFMLSMFALAGAVMDSLAAPEQAAEFRERLATQLNIIKRGSLTAQNAGAARRSL